MWNFNFPPREAKTNMTCQKCKNKLNAKRSCHEAYLYCSHCHTSSQISEYLDSMDAALEKFLENLNCDRT